MRLTTYLRQQAELTPGRAPYPIRLTPAQYTELESEFRRPIAEYPYLRTLLGMHPIVRIPLPTRATGDNVILAPRLDLFSEVERESGIELVSLANSVTSVPDNVACVEVISVGELVTNVRAGDLVFVDFFDVSQGYILASEELYIANSSAFKARYSFDGHILPLDNYVITKRANDRMARALTGSDRIEVPRMILTSGISGGKASDGATATTVLYEEIVSVGNLTLRPRPGAMTSAERALLDTLLEQGEHRELLDTVRAQRERGRTPDVHPGELAVFCQELSVPIRVRGEFCHIVPYAEIQAVIDEPD